MTRKEAIKWLDTDTYIEMCAKAESEGKLIVECLEEANQLAIEALRQQAERDWIPFGGEATNNLLHRIAEYFREWDGHEPAPTMQVHIDDLRTIAQMNSELCALREERRNGRWIPCSERLPDDDGFYLATVLNGLGYTTTQKLLFNGKGWCTDMPWEILAWMPLPEPYKGVE